MKYFTKEPDRNFTKDCLGEALGRCAPLGFSQTVLGEIAMGLLGKIFHVCCPLSCCTVPYDLVLSLYLDERRGVQGNTRMRSREFPRAQPEGTPETEC